MAEASVRNCAIPATIDAQALLEAIQDACLSLNPDWTVTFLNSAAEAFFGRKREDLLGRNLLKEYPGLVASVGHIRIDQVFRDGKRVRVETLSAITGSPIELDIHPYQQGVAVFIRDVRARWELAEQLRNREAQLRLAEESAGIGIWDLDLAADTVRGTPQFFRIMGLEPSADAVPMSVVRGLRLEGDREQVNGTYAAAVEQNRETCDTEYRIQRPDGAVRWIFGRGRIIRDGAGAAVRYSGVDIDVTERKATERALAESEDQLRLAIEAAELGIWDWNIISDEMTWSDRAKQIAGLPAGEPISFAQVRDFTHPGDLPRTWAMAQQALDPALRSSEPYEYRIVRPNGEVRWVLAHGEARFARIDGVEKAVRYTGTIQDITGRKQAEAALVESEARLRLAIEAARQAVWEYDLPSQRLVASPELNRLLGFPEDQPLDIEEIRQRYLPGEQERLRAAGEKALAEGSQFFQIEYRYRRPDDQVRCLLLRAEILLSSPGTPAGVRGVLMDITERKTAEEHRELLHAELQHRVKNTLSLVGAMANQTFARESATAREAFLARLSALGKAHEILSREHWQYANFGEVVDYALAPFRTGDGRFTVGGPEIRLESRQAVTLALCINELATNAAKYGALSGARGRVVVEWKLEHWPEGQTLVFRWSEHDGPAVTPPTRSGFGGRLIEHSLAADFAGSVAMEYLPHGVVCTLRAPWPPRGAPVAG